MESVETEVKVIVSTCSHCMHRYDDGTCRALPPTPVVLGKQPASAGLITANGPVSASTVVIVRSLYPQVEVDMPACDVFFVPTDDFVRLIEESRTSEDEASL